MTPSALFSKICSRADEAEAYASALLHYAAKRTMSAKRARDLRQLDFKTVVYARLGRACREICVGMMAVHPDSREDKPVWTMLDIEPHSAGYGIVHLPCVDTHPSTTLQLDLAAACTLLLDRSDDTDVLPRLTWMVAGLRDIAAKRKKSGVGLDECEQMVDTLMSVLENDCGSVALPVHGSRFKTKMFLPGGKCRDQLDIEDALLG